MMKTNNFSIILMIFIQLCIRIINLAPFVFLLYFVINQIYQLYQLNQLNQLNQSNKSSSNDFEIFDRLDSGIYG